MKPGRELDMLVAEKVMSLKPLGRVPHYSTDISAAWEVVEKINSSKNKWTLNSLRCDPNDGKWQFGDIDRDGSIWPDDKYDSAPLAICLAALKAVGVEV